MIAGISTGWKEVKQEKLEQVHRRLVIAALSDAYFITGVSSAEH
jgi:hypothetical protein